MLMIECNGCHAQAFADCGCPDLGHDPMAAGAHHPQCAFTDLGAAVTCLPGSGCCDGSVHPGASHDQAANACHGQHPAAPCPHNAAGRQCRVIAGMHDGTGAPLDTGACPGGHCGLEVDGCTVCRPVTITVVPGSTTVTMGG